VDDAIRELLEAADQGLVRDHRGHRLTTSAIRELHWYLTGHVSEALGRMRLGDVRRRHLEHLLCDLDDAGLPRRRLRSVVDSVRTLYDYAIERRLVAGNPADRVALPDDTRAHGWRKVLPPRVAMRISDRTISLGLQLATVGFALIAVVLLVGSLWK
jgi:site-specific recombinase XerC